MKNNEYQCAACNNIYEKGWSDEEQEKEMLEYFGNIPEEERRVICDDCFNFMHPLKNPILTAMSKAEIKIHNESL